MNHSSHTFNCQKLIDLCMFIAGTYDADFIPLPIIDLVSRELPPCRACSVYIQCQSYAGKLELCYLERQYSLLAAALGLQETKVIYIDA